MGILWKKGSKVHGSKFKVQSSEFRVQGCGLRIIGATTHWDGSGSMEKVKGNRLYFTARFAKDAKTAKGFFCIFSAFHQASLTRFGDEQLNDRIGQP